MAGAPGKCAAATMLLTSGRRRQTLHSHTHTCTHTDKQTHLQQLLLRTHLCTHLSHFYGCSQLKHARLNVCNGTLQRLRQAHVCRHTKCTQCAMPARTPCRALRPCKGMLLDCNCIGQDTCCQQL